MLTEFKFWRDADGTMRTNFRQWVVYHSPAGMEIGYGGSGPADAALNVLEIAARRMGYKPRRRSWLNGPATEHRVTDVALAHYQEFKWEFIATMPCEGGTISLDAVVEWLEAKVKEA